jgi:hypothetical protein
MSAPDGAGVADPGDTEPQEDTMLTKHIVGGIAATTLLAGATLGMTPAVAGAAACSTGPWPAADEGRPAAHPDASGVYLWHSNDGWHLRVNDPGPDRAVFTGTVRVDGQVLSTGRHLEQRGEGVLTRPRAGIVGYRFTNYGGVDGLDLVTRCSSHLTVRARVDGQAVDAAHVWIGADGHHPDAVPTRIAK